MQHMIGACGREHVQAAFQTSDIILVTCFHDRLDGIQLKSRPNHMTFYKFCRVGVVKHKMDHLSCFIPAMLALGAHAGAVTAEKAKRYMQVTSSPNIIACSGLKRSCRLSCLPWLHSACNALPWKPIPLEGLRRLYQRRGPHPCQLSAGADRAIAAGWCCMVWCICVLAHPGKCPRIGLWGRGLHAQHGIPCTGGRGAHTYMLADVPSDAHRSACSICSIRPLTMRERYGFFNNAALSLAPWDMSIVASAHHL